MAGARHMPGRSPWKGMFAFVANAPHPPDASSLGANVPFQALRPGIPGDIQSGLVHLFRRAAQQAYTPYWLLP
jgi:hypothetical protein